MSHDLMNNLYLNYMYLTYLMEVYVFFLVYLMEVHEDHGENDEEMRIEDEEKEKKNYALMVHCNIRYTYMIKPSSF